MRAIIWTRSARQSYLDLLLSLQERWGDDFAVSFAERVEKLISPLSESPFLYPVYTNYQERKIRRCVISKQSAFFYTVSDNSVELITFFDNRQNPDKLPFNSPSWNFVAIVGAISSNGKSLPTTIGLALFATIVVLSITKIPRWSSARSPFTRTRFCFAGGP